MLRSPQPRFPQPSHPPPSGGFSQPPMQPPQMPMPMPLAPQSQPQPQSPSQPPPHEHEDVIHDAQFDYYGRLVATASSDRTIGIHAVRDGQLQRLSTLRGHEGPVWMLSWAHPRFGLALASASYDHRAIIWREQPPSSGVWRPVHVVDAHQGSVNAVQWAPTRACVATASSDGTVCVSACVGGAWREAVRVRGGGGQSIAHAMGATCVSFAPSDGADGGMWLASGGCDAQVRLWRAADAVGADFHLFSTLAGHTDWVRDVAFAPLCAATRFALLASCGQDRGVVLHRVPWEQLHAACAEDAQKAPASRELAWERSVVMFEEPVWRLAWAPAGGALIVTTGNSDVFILEEGAEFTQPWIKTPLSEYQLQ